MVDNQVQWVLKRMPNLTLTQVDEEHQLGFKQSFKYKSLNAYKYLAYFRAFSNLFDLEYFFNKLPSRAHSLAHMECDVMSGLNFWDENDDAFADDPYVDNETNDPQYSQTEEDSSNPERNALAERVAQRIALEKRHKNQLINDLDSIKDNFMLWEKRMRA